MLKEKTVLVVEANGAEIEAETVVVLIEIALAPKISEDCNFCVQEFVP